MSPLLGVLLAIFALVASVSGQLSYLISFYSQPYHQGDEYHLYIRRNRCYPLSVPSDELSSLRTYGQCVDLYTRDDCFGGMFRMETNETRCHRNLGECDMNDRVSSVRLCPRCRNSCYFPHPGDVDGELEDVGDHETCQCHCNCGGMCPMAGDNAEWG